MTTLTTSARRRRSRGRVRRALGGTALVVGLVACGGVGPGQASTNSASYRLASATPGLKALLTNLFLSSEKRTHTLSAHAQVKLDDGIYAPATRAPAGYRNPVIVHGPANSSWAYAAFIPVVAHTTLRDQVAMQDGGNIAIFAASPSWHVLQIGVGWPNCVKAVLSKFAPARVVTLWLAQRCQ